MKQQHIIDLTPKSKDTINDYISALCEKIDRINPSMHAFLPEEGREQRLLNAATALQNQSRLFGLSVGVKDIFNVDGLPTQAGSKLNPELFQGEQATLVTQLQQAGALIIGKTVTTEFATGGTPAETINPVNPDYSPGGSSSGSAAAVAAGLCELAIGTQTIGSTLRPASYCGIVGFKGSFGRIAVDGLIPYAPSLDTVGLFSQHVSELIPATNILFSNWHTPSTDKNPVLGIPLGSFLEQADKNVLNIFNEVSKQLESSGYIIKPVMLFENIVQINEDLWTLAKYELAQVHKDWYAKYKDLYSMKTQALIEEGQKISERAHQDAQLRQKTVRHAIEEKMAEQGINLWISPAASTYAPKISEETTGNPVMNIPWTFAGFPSLSVPIKQSGEMPLGLQIVAPFMDDEVLLTDSLDLERIIN